MVILQPGTVFANDYKVVRLLDQGGMGAVYVAEQLSTGQERALKLLHPWVLGKDPNAQAHFEQEARVASIVPNAHIVQVIGAGVVDGMPWLAMELLQGETLRARVHRCGLLPIGVVREVVDHLMFALSKAHERGVVHRDIKPENVFVAAPSFANTAFTIKLLDFGIAKVLEHRLETLQTTPMGTPGWMAPEQMYKGSKIGPYTDVWAIGLLVFWLIAGKPYWLSEARRLSQMSVLTEMDLGVVDSASARAGHYGCMRALPPELDAWFARCLARDGTRRFPNVAAAQSELGPILKNVSDPSAASPLPGVSTRPSPVTDPSVSAGVLIATPSRPAPAVTEIASYPPITTPAVPTMVSVPPGPPPRPRRAGNARLVALSIGAATAVGGAGGALAWRSDERLCLREWAEATEASMPRVERACDRTCAA